jgi:hypothetical protein
MDKKDFRMKRWSVTVQGYGEGSYVAASRGKAIAQAWRCDAFGHLTFGQFLKIARCVSDPHIPEHFGAPITIEGKPAFFIDRNRAYVHFAYAQEERVLCAHPYDVLPIEFRPEAYRNRIAA